MKLNLVSEADLTRPEMDNIKLRLSRVEAKEISTVTLGAIPNSLLTAKGDLIVASAASTPARYGVVAPASPAINVLGVANGEDTPTWKTASSAGGADAHIVATNASGYTKLVRLGINTDPDYAIDLLSNTIRVTYGNLILISNNPGAAQFRFSNTGSGGHEFWLATGVQDTSDNDGFRIFDATAYSERFRITNNGNAIFTFGLTINESGGGAASDDFRVASDTEANMLWLDASADLLYLGGSTGVKIYKGGKINAPLTDYANNAAAVTGGLSAGDFYTETGTNPKRVCVVY